MRGVDRDLIREGHYGQRSCEPQKQAEHMGAPTNTAYAKKVLANPEPSTHVGPAPGSDWHTVGPGEFNGDGYSDILWQNVNSGACVIWALNGTNVIDSGQVGWAPGSNWHAIGTGDYNGDGYSDVLLQS